VNLTRLAFRLISSVGRAAYALGVRKQEKLDRCECIAQMNDDKHTSEPISVRLIEDRSRWDKRLTVLALLISTLAVAVSSVVAYLSHQHNKLSVAPLITAWHEPHPTKPEQHWKVTNAGLGPAKITDIALFVNGQRGSGSIATDAHWKELESHKGVTLTVNWGKLLVPGEGFRAGDEIQPFSLRWKNVATMQNEEAKIDTLAVLAICYCSFHKECKYTDSRVHSEKRKDQLIEKCPEQSW
jgi:hypothetical protein